MSASGHFFHARQSSEILPEKFVLKPKSSKRSILAERSQSQINKENGEHPTIRLVDPDSSSPTAVYEKTPFPNLPSQVLKPPRTTKHGYTVQNDGAFPSLNARLRDRSPSPKRSSKLFPQLSLKKSNRISSSTTTSNAETLINDPLYSPVSHRFSTEGTLRNTPTPGLQEREERERDRIEALEALEEQAQEGPSTIRPVTASSGTSGSGSTDRAPNSRDSVRSFGYPVADQSIHPAFRQVLAEHRQSRLSDIQSVDTPISGEQSRGASPKIPSSDYSSEHSVSSPNPGRSSSYNVIKYSHSEDSMSVQFPEVRPPTAQSQSAESWTATESDSLPPLSVARKRQHAHSASAAPAFNHGRPLSTIASESEPSSRVHTRNQFSYGSADVLRSVSRNDRPQHRRAITIGSSSYTSHSSGASGNYEAIQSDNEDSQMDLTGFSMMRAESAVPIPLFSSSPSASRAYEMPADTPNKRETTEEGDDTIAELQSHTLRPQRSGYGLNRRRSLSDPPPKSSRSNQTGTEGTDRTSQGSFIFPQWARHFYKGKSQLGSANVSRASLSRSDSQAFSTRSPMRMMPWAHHRRFESGWESYATGDTGFTSNRPGSSWGNSPAQSSHFLPSIFRPQARGRAYTDITADSTHASDEFYDESDSSPSHSRRNSMEITPAPPRHAVHQPSPLGATAAGKTRSKRQRQRQQGNMTRDTTFSRRYPSTALSTIRPYGTPPHLQPSRRVSNRLSAWRAPSFDEALSTLVKTRQNRQIFFFCLGFICPILWMVAAFLPIPPRPMDAHVTEDDLKVEGGRYTVEPRVLEVFDWEQEKKHMKARWWRNLNRVMSVVGVAIIAAIVSLDISDAKSITWD